MLLQPEECCCMRWMQSRAQGSWQQANLVQHPVQLVACLADAVAVVAVHHEDEALRVLEVMPPQRPDLRAPSSPA
jgi:hypothetical protein